MEKLPSDQVRYPSHSWGVFAQDRSLDVGIAGVAWAAVVRSALASSHSAGIQTSRSSSVVRMTGIAFGWMGWTTAFGEVVRNP
jgi:hypothetical protein